MSRLFYNQRDYILNEADQTITILPHMKIKLDKLGYKKIGGSTIGYVINNQFDSHFKAFCHTHRLLAPVFDTKYVDAGVVIEPKIHSFLEDKYQTKIDVYKGEDYNWDLFKENRIFGGLPDGFAKDLNHVFEIKTTNIKNYTKWRKWNKHIIPDNYIEQASLYTYLLGVSEFSIVVAYLKDEDYKNPELVKISDNVDLNTEARLVEIFKFNVNKDFVDKINIVKKWYIEAKQSVISPSYSKYSDDQVEYLRCKNEEEYQELLERNKLKFDHV